MTLASWTNLEQDLKRELLYGQLKPGTMGIWQMVKDCLGRDIYKPIISAGQEALDEIQDSMSETERSERLQLGRELTDLRKQALQEPARPL